MNKQILYIDMDGVICNFIGYIQSKLPHIFEPGYNADEKDAAIDAYMQLDPHLFEFLEPMPDAIESVKELSKHYDVFFLSTPPYDLPMAYTSKRLWLEKYFGELAKKKLILTHRKDLCIGDYLIDDRTKNGAGEFKGELITFDGVDGKCNWKYITNYLITVYGLNKKLIDCSNKTCYNILLEHEKNGKLFPIKLPIVPRKGDWITLLYEDEFTGGATTMKAHRIILYSTSDIIKVTVDAAY